MLAYYRQLLPLWSDISAAWRDHGFSPSLASQSFSLMLSRTLIWCQIHLNCANSLCYINMSVRILHLAHSICNFWNCDK